MSVERMVVSEDDICVLEKYTKAKKDYASLTEEDRVNIVKTEEDWVLRYAAVEGILNQNVLADIALKDCNMPVRNMAANRITNICIINKLIEDGISLDIASRKMCESEKLIVEEMKRVRLTNDPNKLILIMEFSYYDQVIIEALKKINDPDIIDSIACNTKNLKVCINAMRMTKNKKLLIHISDNCANPYLRKVASQILLNFLAE